MAKIIDKIRTINEVEKRPFYSFEYFPPKVREAPCTTVVAGLSPCADKRP